MAQCQAAKSSTPYISILGNKDPSTKNNMTVPNFLRNFQPDGRCQNE